MKTKSSASFRFIKLLPLLFLFLPALVLAIDLADRINAATNKLKDLDKQIDVLDKEVGEPLVAEKARLVDTDTLLKGAVKNLKAKYADLDRQVKGPGGFAEQWAAHQAKMAPFNAKVQDYHSRCGGTYTDPSYVTACDREKVRLDAEAKPFKKDSERLKGLQNKLKKEREYLDSRAEAFQDQRNVLNQATTNWMEKKKNYNADHNDLVAAYTQVSNQLKQLLSQYSACIDVLPINATDEEIKHRCGNVQFDNVRKRIQELQEIKPEWVVSIGK